MDLVKVQKLLETEYSKYEKRTAKSKEIISPAKQYLPGGDTRSVTFFKPYPTFIKEGKGFQLTDVDENKYIDYLNNYTSLVHGHAHPKVLEALEDQLQKGWAFGSPMECQYKLGKILCERFSSVNKVRFNSSGTEGTLSGLRIARTFTHKDKILKMEGAYHGSHLSVEVSVHPKIEDAGPSNNPQSVPEGGGIPQSLLNDIIIAPFNNIDATETIIKKHHKELAAVIVEPVMGACGMIPATEDYLKSLREITEQYDILLIVDEVMMLRLSLGGGQQFYGITSDLTCFGKIIGGGLPAGGIGGREDIMDLFNPYRSNFIPHSGTFNANALTMVAGTVYMEMLNGSSIEKINSLGNQLKNGIEKIFEEQQIPGQVTGAGSLYNIHFSQDEVVDYRTVQQTPNEMRNLLHMLLFNRGIFIAPRGMFNMSTIMSEKEVQAFLDVMGEVSPILKSVF